MMYCIDSSEKIRADHSYGFYLKGNSMYFTNNEKSKKYPLYPYHPIDLKTTFVYGDDFNRQTDIFLFPASMKILCILIVLLFITSVTVLRIIRRNRNLQRGDLSSTVFDCVIAFVNGGNLEMRHKWEKWFFGILLFSVFFIVSVLVGDLLDSVIRVRNSKIDTFDKLADIRAPIYISLSLQPYNDTVYELLR